MESSITEIVYRNSDPSLNIALDTILLKKQCIIFVNTKRSAESLAEKLSQIILKDKRYDYKLIIAQEKLSEVSSDIFKVLSPATKQCLKLSECVKFGAAFHHSGLVSEQRKLVEENFKEGNIKVIVATPTLAIGVDLPAFRVIIRDLKRFGNWGMQYIPVLEYEQQAGRAGRPSYDSFGEAICIADDKSEKQEIYDTYILGVPEPIVSKLAVEPIMRTYILSLISSEFIRSRGELEEFFSETFYAKHYGDTKKLNDIIHRMIDQLEEWGFIITGEADKDDVDKDAKDAEDKKKIKDNDFVSAFKIAFKKSKGSEERLSATLLGKRVSELYLDPYTAHGMIESLTLAVKKKSDDLLRDYSIMHMICTCLELRPLLRVKSKEVDDIVEKMNQNQGYLITEVYEMFDEQYEDFLSSIKTAEFFMQWLDEKDEEFLLERYDVRPGELHAKRERADWLLYACEELSKLLKMHVLIKEISKLRFRLKYGVREELIPLLQLKNIGRVRARKMYDNRIHDLSDVKSVDLTTLTQLIGKNVALDIKRQVGQELSEEKVQVKEHKRKGQKNLGDY